jgi:ABC-type antimicrobial peptide transport system permease subunit
VAQRTREFGIRIALGAGVPEVVETVCAQFGWPLSLGLIIGLIMAIFLLRVTNTFLFGVRANDPLSLTLAIVFVLFCSGCAAAIPSRRAVKLDPAAALRQNN